MYLSFVVLSILCTSVLSYEAVNTTVSTSSGWVQGSASSSHKYWLGIPYAQPPVGPLRWSPPQPAQAWTGVKDATAFGSECTQNGGGQEDCLFVNVFSPIYPNGGKLLPVYVWVHGGGFVSGSGNLNGQYLSGNDTVVVSINYRLGTLGFFASEALLNQSSVATTGFYGIQDQRFAFAWVQKNIEAFGGDPTRVTIGGESAGGNSMCIHLAAPRSAGLFRGVVMESGLCGVWDWETGIAASAKVVINAGCSGAAPSELECMMAKNASFLVSSYRPPTGFVYYPTMHPYEFVEFPLQLFQQGTYNKVPLLAGTNQNEGSIWICPQGNISVAQYTSELDSAFNSSVGPLVFNEYPLKNYAAPINALIDISSDIWFKCITSDVLIAISTNAPSIENFLYSFEHITASETEACLGVPHGAELAYIFGSSGLTPQEQQLSMTMRNLWTSFIVDGKPSGGPVEWPVFDSATQSYLVLNLNITTASQYRQPYCQFWNQHPQDPAIQP